MSLKTMTKEQLEVLSYADLTELILNESTRGMNTPSIFKKICTLLELSDDEYTSQIGDFYTSLTTDKRFILLDNRDWDLRDRHSSKIVIGNDDEDDEEEDDDSVVETVESEDIDEMEEEENIEQEDDDIEDLTIIDDDDMDDNE